MTMLDQRNQARWAYEERARQAQEKARAAYVTDDPIKPIPAGISLNMPRVPLGIQYMQPDVQPTPAPIVSRPLTKRELCARDCGCSLTICYKYGNVRD